MYGIYMYRTCIGNYYSRIKSSSNVSRPRNKYMYTSIQAWQAYRTVLFLISEGWQKLLQKWIPITSRRNNSLLLVQGPSSSNNRFNVNVSGHACMMSGLVSIIWFPRQELGSQGTEGCRQTGRERSGGCVFKSWAVTQCVEVLAG